MTTNPGSPPPDLDELGRRIDAARQSHQPARPSAQDRSALGVAVRLSTEFVAAVAIGGGIGWLLDRWLNTGPLFLLVMFVVGVVAAFVTVFRTARDLERNKPKPTADALKRVPDDEDD